MAQSIWSGHVRFGLVHIPVRLYSATQPKDVAFHQYREAEQLERIRTRKVGAVTGEPADTVVRGFEREDGEVVLITDDDLASVAAEKSKVLEVQQFCAIEEIDPVYFEKSYWVGPAPSVGAETPLELFRRTLLSEGLVALGTFVMRSKEHVAVMRAADDGLMLHTLFYVDEVRPASIAGHDPSSVTVNERELEMARQLLLVMKAPWNPEEFRDEYRARLLELIDAKATGRPMLPVAVPALGTAGADIFSALEASVRAFRSGEPLASALGKEAEGEVLEAPAAELKTAAAGSKRMRVTARVSPPGESGGLDGMTLGELREEAKRRGVAGRSKMSRDELIAALS